MHSLKITHFEDALKVGQTAPELKQAHSARPSNNKKKRKKHKKKKKELEDQLDEGTDLFDTRQQ